MVLSTLLVAAVAELSRYRIMAGFVMSSIPVPLKTRHVGEAIHVEYVKSSNVLPLAQNKDKWLKPPFRKWYKGKRPGVPLYLPCDRQSKTCLSQLPSGPVKSFTFSRGNKRFPNCQLEQPSLQHILDCLGLVWEDFHDSPLLVPDFIKVNGFTDIV
ncbi:uncharacterized protein TNCV_1799771 [Trichonephila clavipes]|nr:uncharacterized protein TNCV_1799771 [Trichonephila clavipes]